MRTRSCWTNLPRVSAAAAVLSSAYPVSIHKRAVTAAQLVQWRPLPANHEAALAHSLDDLDRADLSRSFWRWSDKEGSNTALLFFVVHPSLNAHRLIYFCLTWSSHFSIFNSTATNSRKQTKGQVLATDSDTALPGLGLVFLVFSRAAVDFLADLLDSSGV